LQQWSLVNLAGGLANFFGERSMNAHPQSRALPAKSGLLGPATATRRVRLLVGLFITGFPLAVWGFMNLAFGSDFAEKNSYRLHFDAVQLRVWLLIAAGLLELIAVFVLRKSDQKPRDWISIVSLVDTGLSILLAVFFWAQISLLIFGAT
jgi:hypothetical protein